MKPRFSHLLASLALGACLAPSMPQAAPIVGNSGSSTNAVGQGNPTTFLAAGFVSPTVATDALNVSARFQAGSGAPNVTLQLFSDAAGVPGAPIGSFGSATVTTTQQDHSFVAASPISLLPSTAYWLVASCSNCVFATELITNNWITHDPVTTVGLSGASVVTGIRNSNDSGATWNNLFQGPSARTAVFVINGDVASSTNVPAPSVALLLIAGAAGLIGSCRVHTRRSTA